MPRSTRNELNLHCKLNRKFKKKIDLQKNKPKGQIWSWAKAAALGLAQDGAVHLLHGNMSRTRGRSGHGCEHELLTKGASSGSNVGSWVM